MHLAYLTPAYPPLPGGGERYVRSLAAELARQGVGITVITSHAQRESDFWHGCVHKTSIVQGAGIEIIRCPIRPFPCGYTGLLAWRKLMVSLSMLPGTQSPLLQRMTRLIPPLQGLDEALERLRGRVDLVHGFNLSWEYPLMAGWQWARRQNLPFVATPFAHFGSGRRDRVARNNMMDHQRQLLNEADAVLALTSVEIENMRRWRVTPRCSDVLGGGLDPLPPPLDPSTVLQKYGLDRPFALFVGRASRNKGALVAADAARTLARRHPDFQLIYIGQSTHEFDDYYRALPADAPAQIRHLGIVSETEKHALLEACTMLLLPSHSDSFGIVFLEAWAHGKPVVGANAGGIPGVVDDGSNGLLVPFGDASALAQAIERLLTEPDLRHTMGQRGREKVAQVYNWQEVAGRALDTYRQLLQGE